MTREELYEEIETTKIHYVKVPENHIVIDFDIPDSDYDAEVGKLTKQLMRDLILFEGMS